MRQLTEEELSRLESIVEDDTLYLFLRDAEKSERLFRLHYASHDQRVKAQAIRQSYYWQLRKQGDLKTGEEVEAEFADELKSLRQQMSDLRERNRKADIQRIELLAHRDLPDIEVDEKAFNEKVMEIGREVDDVTTEMLETSQRMTAILCNSIDYLSRQRYVAAIAAMCWECQVDGKWEPVWGDFQKFRSERSALANTLEAEAAWLLRPGADFFGSLPLRVSGGSDTSQPSQESEDSSPEQ